MLEFVNVFTHSEEIDYFLPGIAPTGKEIEIETVVVAKFRGDKLYYEHIYWDQASIWCSSACWTPRAYWCWAGF